MKQACPGTWIAGCDISDVALSRAKSLDACFRVDLNHECLPVAPESVDLVTMSEVLEHLVDPSQVLMDVRRVLVPGGCVVATVPNFAFWRFRLQALCGKVPPVTADDRHFHSFSAGSLARLLAAAGFRVVRMAGLRQRLHWLGSISYRLLCDTLLVEARREE
jgi:ubiquinone/menaquinone biosynthesis C-methylase UbiE